MCCEHRDTKARVHLYNIRCLLKLYTVRETRSDRVHVGSRVRDGEKEKPCKSQRPVKKLCVFFIFFHFIFYTLFLDNFFRVFHRRISTYSGGKGKAARHRRRRYWCLHTKAKGPPGGGAQGGRVTVRGWGGKNKQNSQNSARIQFLCTVFDLFLLLNFLFRSLSVPGRFFTGPRPRGGWLCMHYKSRLFSNKMIHTGARRVVFNALVRVTFDVIRFSERSFIFTQVFFFSIILFFFRRTYNNRTYG